MAAENPTTRPILFSGPMVRAILAGTKTQTRRLMRPQADEFLGDMLGQPWVYARTDGETDLTAIRCPYGVPGDRLWVRETWSDCCPLWPHWCGCGSREMVERTHSALYRADTNDEKPSQFTGKHAWRPSIHMPRWASRLTLEVTDVRVQRLQDISEEDAIAEGIDVAVRATVPGEERRMCVTCGQHRSLHIGTPRACPGGYGTTYTSATYRGGFAFLWQSLNEKRAPWDSNPWVWAVTFRRLA